MQVCIGLRPLSGIKQIFLNSCNLESFGTETPLFEKARKIAKCEGVRCDQFGAAWARILPGSLQLR
jgi:hypothetical protein